MTEELGACRAPLDWETPTGKTAKVKLELQLSAFFGYGKNDTDSYLGLQAHGVLWVADPTQAPVNWPIAPPIVAGKVGASHGPRRHDAKFLGQSQPTSRSMCGKRS